MTRKSLILGLSTLLFSQQGWSQLWHCKETTEGKDQLVFALDDNPGQQRGLLYEKVTPKPAFGIMPRDRTPWFRVIPGTVTADMDTTSGNFEVVHIEEKVQKVDCFDVSVRRHYDLKLPEGSTTYSGKVHVNWAIKKREQGPNCRFAPYPLPAETSRTQNHEYECESIAPDLF